MPGDASPSEPRGADLEEQAIAWLLEREEGFTPDRERDFAAWCAADPLHARAVRRMEQTLGVLEEMPRHRPLLAESPARTPAGRSSGGLLAWSGGSHAARVVTWLGLAASVLVTWILGVHWRGERVPEVPYFAAATAAEQVRLEDGSAVELNAASKVRVRFGPSTRRVTLDAGEAYFEVAANAARPFIVEAGGVRIRAIGTAFNVRFAPGAVEVVVTEGSVAIDGNGTDPDPAATPPVVAGERAWVQSDRPVEVAQIDPAALRDRLSWQGAFHDFADAPLRLVVARFNVRNREQLVLEDPALGEYRIGGRFALAEVDAFVRLLEREGVVVAERHGDAVIALRSAR